MPRARSTEQENISQYGYHNVPDRIGPAEIKDISKLQPNRRRLNDYTTIPRWPRAHHQRSRDDHVQTSKPRDHAHTPDQGHTHVTKSHFAPTISHHVTETRDNSHEDINKSSQSSLEKYAEPNECKKERTWSFSKWKNVLKRSKSLKNESAKPQDSSSLNPSCGEHSPTAGNSVRRSNTSIGSPLPEVDHLSDNEDIYADIDNLKMNSRSRVSLPVLSATDPGSMCNVVFPEQRRIPVSESSQRSGVFKALSLLTIRKAKGSKKPTSECDYQSKQQFLRDQYRGSFKDTTVGCRLSDTRCKRSKSFSNPAEQTLTGISQLPTRRDVPMMNSTIYSRQPEYETKGGEMLYSLAQADDTPPPLPERTYLKRRKENITPETKVYSTPCRNDVDLSRSINFPLKEQNNNHKPAAYPNTIPEHVRIETYATTSRRRQQKFSHEAAQPFLLHQVRCDGDQRALSSGYSSVASEHTDPDYSRMPPPPPPPPICTIPSRSHLSNKSEKLRTIPGFYSNREDERSGSDSSHSRLGSSDSQKSDEDDQSPGARMSNVIHNLPLPPGPGGAQLVKTLQLGRFLKNKWISGIAVTKKNEYIVVDQREAYLLDEEGNLKKTIGSKGSNRLIEPFDVCVCPSSGHLVICDHADRDVKIFTCKGQFVTKVKDEALTNIAGVAVTSTRNIVIAGTDKQRVSILNEDGRLVRTIPNTEEGTLKPKNRIPFEHPYSVAVNPLTGDVMVGDDNKQIVTSLSGTSDEQPTRVSWWYCPGPQGRHFFPSSICADSEGYIFIADLYNEKIYMLDSSGKFVKTLLSRGDGLKGGPGAIATDSRGHLLVADEEKVIKIFRYRDENGFAVNKRYSYCPQAT